jgi:hypothetical protein
LAADPPADFIFATLDRTIAAWNPNVALAWRLFLRHKEKGSFRL